MDPSMGFNNDIKRPQTATLEQLVSAGPDSLEDREKWTILTRELVQKQEIVHRLMQENDDKT